jgi:TRAP transporter 4TM/12TM fusion protein
VLFRSVYTDEGMFGSIAGISASFVFIFVLFGSFLMRSGGGEFVIDLARVASRGFLGGSGYVAVAASALTGTISGSAVANTVTTGVVTIPLMKSSNFRPAFAAAVEAAASTGGQMMPPVMGAGVFLIASYTQSSYGNIVMISIVPAILFFLSIGLGVRIEAKRSGMKLVPFVKGEAGVKQVVRQRGASFLIPVVGVVAILSLGYSAIWAGVSGILLVIATSWITLQPMRPRDIILALAEGANNAALTCLLLVAIGLVVNVIAMTGVGATFSLMIVEWSAGNLLLALLLIAIASLVLGMGLPVTAAYVVLATLSAPALAQIVATQQIIGDMASGQIAESVKPILLMFDSTLAGVGHGEAAARAFLQSLPSDALAVLTSSAIDPAMMSGFLIAAHLAIFWLSQDSNVTPPVCLTGYAAATIAGSKPMQTSMIAWRIAKSIYVMPVAFFTTPILDGTLSGALIGGGITLLSLCLMLIALEGYFQSRVSILARALMMATGVAILLVQALELRGVLAIASIMLLLLATFTPAVLQFPSRVSKFNKS